MSSQTTTSVRYASMLAYFFLLLVVSGSVYSRRAFYADVVPYAAVVISSPENDPQTVHASVMRQLTAEFGPGKNEVPCIYRYGLSPWWQALLNSPEGLLEEERFYSNKPLFVLAARVLVRHTSLDAIHALYLVSALSLIPIGIMLLVWASNPLAAALLLLSPSLLDAGRIATPDALSTALLFPGLYLLFRRQDRWACGLLIASIYARPDNLILLGVVVLWLVYEREMGLVEAGTISVLGLISFLAISRLSGFYGWQALIIQSIDGVPFPAHHVFHLTFAGYLLSLYSGIRAALIKTEIAVWILVGVLAVKQLGGADRLAQLLIVVAASQLIRFLLYPFPLDRYFLPAYLLAGIALVRAVGLCTPRKRSSSTGPDLAFAGGVRP
jgi:hypothetical protein